jgi:hypothetical protein
MMRIELKPGLVDYILAHRNPKFTEILITKNGSKNVVNKKMAQLSKFQCQN